MPSFSSPKVTVTGQKEYSAEEIARLLLPMNATSWFNFGNISLQPSEFAKIALILGLRQDYRKI